jgi:integrase
LIAQENGKPIKSRHLGTIFQKAIEAAGLSNECVLHGLRKTAAKMLAEAGCTAHEIMSITGHRDLKMLEHYTKAAGQKGLAQSAMDKWGKRVPENGNGT